METDDMNCATPSDPHANIPDPKDDLDALESNLTTTRARHSQAAEECGYQIEVVQAIRSYWSEGIPDPAAASTVASGAIVLHEWRKQAEDWNKQATVQGETIAAASSTASGIAYTTAVLASVAPAHMVHLVDIKAVAGRRQENDFIRDGLKAIDSSLAVTYSTVWQFEHLSPFDPHRGSLFLMRQVFDHLLEKLAPDAQVALQPGFMADPALLARNGVGVTRTHRLKFVADTREIGRASCRERV